MVSESLEEDPMEISVEPVGSEFTRLEGTDLAIESVFNIEGIREDGLRIRATAHVVDGRRLVCRSLKLTTETGEIDRRLLHGLSLATLLRQAVNGAVYRVGQPTPDERAAGASRFDAGVVRAELQRYMQGVPLVGPRQLTDDFLRQVADVYRQAIKDKRATWEAVAALQKSWFGLETSAEEATARRWIQTARKRGSLGQTKKGQKGG
jgi:hypothetical protein